MASSNSFVMKLYHLDWYLAEPHSGLGDASVSGITGKRSVVCPVIRLYGHVVAGEAVSRVQCCVHVHGYHPKVLLDSEGFPDNFTERQLGDGLDRLMNLGNQNAASVVDVRRVRRTDIYGYHEVEQEIFEVRYANPSESYKLAHAYKSLCARYGRNGKIFELHIPYTLQFVSECGLAAGATIRIEANACSVRPPSDRHSRCSLEIDAPCSGIYNPEEAHGIFPTGGRLSTSQPDSQDHTVSYPRPSPLSTSQSGGSSSMMCQRLRTLWRGEHERCLAAGEEFPYVPEGRATGRPTPQSMPCHSENSSRLEALRDSVAKQEAASGSQGAHHSQKAALEDFFEVVPDEAVGEDIKAYPEASRHAQVDLPADSGMLVNEYAESNSSGSSAASDVGFEVMCPASNIEAETSAAEMLPRLNELYEFLPDPPSLETVLEECCERPTISPRYLSAPDANGAVGDSSSVDYCTLLYLELVVQVPRGVNRWDAAIHPIVGAVCVLRDQRQTPMQRKWVCTIGDLLNEDEIMAVDTYCTLQHASCESELILALDHVFGQFDPTVVVSWDASRKGIVYAAERARSLRVPNSEYLFHRVCIAPVPGPMGASTLFGRITLDLWQTLRQEDSLKLSTTTLHGAARQLLGLTLPNIPMWLLQDWWTDRALCLKAFKYTSRMVLLALQLLDASTLLSRASEMSSVLGMPDVEEVLTRGSQYRVECILHRAATRSGFALVTSSKAQVKAQPALEGTPMILEPRSGYYRTPTIILDFQSLYPSIIIAYNMCYSTCLGRVEHLDVTVPLGTQRDKPHTIKRSSSILQDDNVVVAANGVVFVQPSCRVGILPRMLHEVLQTRFMVKRAMKRVNSKDSPALYRIMDARQLGLKLLANVTYGYAGASFSGRMPCSELADAIVLTARRTLQQAMSIAEDMGATVLYGDTDSMFIRPPSESCGSVEAAFEFGGRLADCVTSVNPWPIKLQLEKVCMPCILVSKKRYCGWAYEHPKAKPEFFAKGIETVRRDSCPFTAKSVHSVLEAMFRTDPTADETLHLEAGRRAGREIIRRLYSGEISKTEFIFQNQVRLNYRSKNLPPAAHVAALQGLDTGYKERVAYVVARKAGDRSNAKLLDRVVPPYRIAGSRNVVIDADYYLTKQFFPAVQRILAPILPSVAAWLTEDLPAVESMSSECFLCHHRLGSRQGTRWVCETCLDRDPALVAFAGSSAARGAEARSRAARLICTSCTEGSVVMAAGCTDAYHCDNYFVRCDAPIEELRARRNLGQLDNRLPGTWEVAPSQLSGRKASSGKTELQSSQSSEAEIISDHTQDEIPLAQPCLEEDLDLPSSGDYPFTDVDAIEDGVSLSSSEMLVGDVVDSVSLSDYDPPSSEDIEIIDCD
ncbi:DNA polymerase zeta catalytic subunit [Perkinsus chesapeaki]|uniref:DNA polymerase n=1 Tax=Perkinsus chesapeaki TaxID=330153 RepID=A0A7J6MHY1_PERCH|nr:DNA polymerase zeta catalytic subunit [Perkinsus chesapeaki]